jgi:hypothetical protein
MIYDGISKENSYLLEKNIRKLSLNEYEEILKRKNNNKKKTNSLNIFGSIYKLFYILIKIILKKIKAHGSILILLLFALIFSKRKILLKNLKFIIDYIMRRFISS